MQLHNVLLNLKYLHSPTGGSDYVNEVNSSILFFPGIYTGNQNCTDITILDNSPVEIDLERFGISLSSNDPVDISNSSGVIYIYDDDSK